MSAEQKIIKIIRENIETEVEVCPESNLRNDLALDSFGTLMIINALEEEFHIAIDSADFDNLRTVSDIITALNEKLSPNNS